MTQTIEGFRNTSRFTVRLDTERTVKVQFVRAEGCYKAMCPETGESEWWSEWDAVDAWMHMPRLAGVA